MTYVTHPIWIRGCVLFEIADIVIYMTSSTKGTIKFVKNDGGRAAAGFEGIAGDCVVRAIAVATDQPENYRLIHNTCSRHNASMGYDKDADNGVLGAETLMTGFGYEQVATATTETGRTVKVAGKTLAQIAKWFPNCVVRTNVRRKYHMVAIVDGELQDSWDSNWRYTNSDEIRRVRNVWIRR